MHMFNNPGSLLSKPTAVYKLQTQNEVRDLMTVKSDCLDLTG